jgi:hypothetical protein
MESTRAECWICRVRFFPFRPRPNTLIFFVSSNSSRLDSRILSFKVRSEMVDQSSPLTERQGGLPSLSYYSPCFVVLIRWWCLLLRRQRQSHHFACPLVSYDRLHGLLLCCVSRRGGNCSVACLRHRVATDRINRRTQSLFIRLWEKGLIMSTS